MMSAVWNAVRVINIAVLACIVVAMFSARGADAYWGGRGRGSSLALAKRFESFDPLYMGDEQEYGQWDPMERRLAFADTSSYLPFYQSSLAKRNSNKPVHVPAGDSKSASALPKYQWKR